MDENSPARARRCFVLMPFDPKYREVYERVYRPVAEDNGLACWRVDEVARPGSITRDIVEGIVEADVIVADLTGRNANVFYELGISHAVGNKTIMTAQAKEDVPFDIASYRVIFYDQSIAGAERLRTSLGDAIKELLRSLERTNNPVQEALGGVPLLSRAARTPLFTALDPSDSTSRIRDFLRAESINYLDQLRNLDLERVERQYGFGRISLAKLVAVLVDYNLFDDTEWLNQFVMRRGLRPNQYRQANRRG